MNPLSTSTIRLNKKWCIKFNFTYARGGRYRFYFYGNKDRDALPYTFDIPYEDERSVNQMVDMIITYGLDVIADYWEIKDQRSRYNHFKQRVNKKMQKIEKSKELMGAK